MSEWIPQGEWETIVRHVPIVSVDLVVECPDGIVLGKRANEPAKGEWFVPGGRVRKGEALEDAVIRVAREELNTTVEIREQLGVFEHLYDESDVGDSKHYVANGYRVWTDETTFDSGGQHEQVGSFTEPPTGLHPYVEQYLDVMS